jgi:hypothetical protein
MLVRMGTSTPTLSPEKRGAFRGAPRWAVVRPECASHVEAVAVAEEGMTIRVPADDPSRGFRRARPR